jgi:uncharacterized protein
MGTGEITHVELPADDVERAKAFYAAVAGWEFGEAMPGYWTFRTSPASGGGIGRRGKSIGNVVRVYITVESLEAAVSAAEAHGGSIVAPPTEVGEGFGRYAAVTDSEGNEIGLWQDVAQAAE